MQISLWIKKIVFTVLVVQFALIQLTLPVSACTLYAATGTNTVAKGGTLVAKNRDWRPEQQQLRVVKPHRGYKYLGLFSGKSLKFNAAGINEKGLLVAMSTESSIPKEQRRARPCFKSPEGLRSNEYILRYYKSVDEVLKTKKSIWREPTNFILADKNTIAYVEVAPNGKIAVKKTKRGTLYHTNHYVEAPFTQYNVKIGKSSAVRYKRIKSLMTTHKALFTLKDFETISQDRNAGPNNSIYRLGNTPHSTQTIASFIAYIPPEGSAEVYVKYRPRAKGKELIRRIKLSEALK